jgi:hypothetical protein
MSGTRKMPPFELGDGAAPNPAPAGKRDVSTLQTRVTRKFVDLADSVTSELGELTIGAGGYAVELTAPEGMSTGGGKQALQHLRLSPRRPGYPTIVFGTVNAVEHRAELRDHDHFMAMNEARFGGVVDITRPEWDRLLGAVERVLAEARIVPTRTPPPRELLEQRRPAEGKSRTSPGAILALVVVILLVAIVAWRVAYVIGAGS